MNPTKYPRIKICCISSIEEAEIAINLGASALGLVGNMPSGPGVISDELIAKIVLTIPPPIASFLLTSETDAGKIIEHHKKVNSNTIQIVDKLETGTYGDIRKALPTVNLVQVIHVVDESSILEAIEISKHVDAILLDSGNPKLKVKELGGTGRVHNWELSKEIRERLDIPIFLAGGIGPHNVVDAIKTVEPFGIDLCNSVRTDGKLDAIKLTSLFEEINKLEK
jgi:phosphoribosylanthranilate isomerase